MLLAYFGDILTKIHNYDYEVPVPVYYGTVPVYKGSDYRTYGTWLQPTLRNHE